MSDEIERRLRAAGHQLPDATDADTQAARAHAVAAFRAPRARVRKRPLALAFALVLLVGGAFGVGYALATNGSGVKTRVVRERQALDAGPGFLPAAGWDTVSAGTSTSTLAAIAANVPLAAGDRALLGPPVETARKLGPNGVLFYVTFSSVSAQQKLPQRLLPLQLGDAKQAGSTRRLQAHVGAWDLDVVVFLGSARPSAGVLVAVREELGRLVVPACPAAQPLTAADSAAAKRYLLDWLPAHYSGDAADAVGATATAAAGAAAPRHGEAVADCGPTVADRSVEVDVTLPRLAKVSASLSELTFFLAKTADGWTVWERAR